MFHIFYQIARIWRITFVGNVGIKDSSSSHKELSIVKKVEAVGSTCLNELLEECQICESYLPLQDQSSRSNQKVCH